MDISVYPNPMRDYFKIEFKMPNDSFNGTVDFQINLYDSKGCIILSEDGQTLQNIPYLVDIDSSLESGVYILQIITNKEILTKHLAKH